MAELKKAGAAAKGNAAPNAAAETARKAAQLEWALEQLGGETNKVVVVPVFKLDKKKGWVPSDEIIRQGNNKAFASLLLMALPGGTGRERWQDKQWALASSTTGNFLVTALAPMPIEDAEKYEAGQLLDGRIDTAYTLIPPNPKNLDQDKWYISADAREMDIPATDADGNVYYQKRYFEDDLSYPVQPQPRINRQQIVEEIMAAKAGA